MALQSQFNLYSSAELWMLVCVLRERAHCVIWVFSTMLEINDVPCQREEEHMGRRGWKSVEMQSAENKDMYSTWNTIKHTLNSEITFNILRNLYFKSFPLFRLLTKSHNSDLSVTIFCLCGSIKALACFKQTSVHYMLSNHVLKANIFLVVLNVHTEMWDALPASLIFTSKMSFLLNIFVVVMQQQLAPSVCFFEGIWQRWCSNPAYCHTSTHLASCCLRWARLVSLFEKSTKIGYRKFDPDVKCPDSTLFEAYRGLDPPLILLYIWACTHLKIFFSATDLLLKVWSLTLTSAAPPLLQRDFLLIVCWIMFFFSTGWHFI